LNSIEEEEISLGNWCRHSEITEYPMRSMVVVSEAKSSFILVLAGDEEKKE
jgi:hypothetical protein